MTPTATYIADENCLQLLPYHEKWPRSAFTSDEAYQVHIDLYNETISKLPRIPCDPSCKGLWADGQKLVEGNDYEVHSICGFYKTDCGKRKHCEDCRLVAVPLVPAGEDEFVWTDELVKEYAEQYRFSSSRISIEQFKYSLTKR